MVASVNSKFDPNKLYAHQTWVRFAKGQTLVGVNESDTTFASAGKTGGEKTHTLTVAEMPSHNHNYAVYAASGNAVSGFGHLATYGGTNKGWSSNVANTGGSTAHNNLQPYTTVYYWKRTA